MLLLLKAHIFSGSPGKVLGNTAVGGKKKCIWQLHQKNTFLGQKQLFLVNSPYESMLNDHQSSLNTLGWGYSVQSIKKLLKVSKIL